MRGQSLHSLRPAGDSLLPSPPFLLLCLSQPLLTPVSLAVFSFLRPHQRFQSRGAPFDNSPIPNTRVYLIFPPFLLLKSHPAPSCLCLFRSAFAPMLISPPRRANPSSSSQSGVSLAKKLGRSHRHRPSGGRLGMMISRAQRCHYKCCNGWRRAPRLMVGTALFLQVSAAVPFAADRDRDSHADVWTLACFLPRIIACLSPPLPRRRTQACCTGQTDGHWAEYKTLSIYLGEVPAVEFSN